MMIAPHGGSLVDLLATRDRAAELQLARDRPAGYVGAEELATRE